MNYFLICHRPHSKSGCFQTGYVLNGVPKFDGGISSTCPNGPPKGGKWFTARVEVRGVSASIYRDGLNVRSTKTRFPAKGRGGVIVANGYKNIIQFRNFRLKALPTHALTSQSCLAVRNSGKNYVLDANHGKWPADGFCRALYPTTVNGPNYQVSAQLYNQIGWSGVNAGHLGLMYNVKDIDNFDFVYFRY